MIELPDWKATIRDDANPAVVRMLIYREDMNGLQLVTGWSEWGYPETTTISPANTTIDFHGFVVPRVVADVIRRGLDPEKDRSGELDAVRESLSVERKRVDDILKSLTR